MAGTKAFRKRGAGKLAAPVTMENHAAGRLGPAGRFKGFDTQFFLHVVVHSEAHDLTVIAIQNRSNIQLAVLAWNLCNISQPLSVFGASAVKFACNQIVSFLSGGIRFRSELPERRGEAFIRPPFSHRAPHCAFAYGECQVLLKRQPNTIDSIVVVIWILCINLFDFDQKQLPGLRAHSCDGKL
jgi:hypothetical protein